MTALTLAARDWRPETPLDWQALAACRDADPRLFFPEDKSGRAARAKRVCSGCPVIDECLAYALANHERHGVWGGLSERERRRINPGQPAPRIRLALPAPPRPCAKGHMKTPDNVYKDGSCRQCTLDRNRKSKRKRRAARAEARRLHREQELAA